jgi:hypothetical protein
VSRLSRKAFNAEGAHVRPSHFACGRTCETFSVAGSERRRERRPSTARVDADPLRLQQVLVDLLASSFSAPQTAICLEAMFARSASH